MVFGVVDEKHIPLADGIGFVPDDIDALSPDSVVDLQTVVLVEGDAAGLDLRGIREEMERERAARAANAAYFGWKEDDIAKLKETQETILEAMKHPKLVLEAAAFVWMVKGNDE